MKKVLLTGGSRGIGLEIKKIFESNGYFVYAPTRNELDLSNIDSIKKFIENHKNDTYDVLVNNAGINEINLIENVKETDIENTFNINLIAPIYLLKSFVPKMKTQKYGRIVNIASIWSVVSKPGRGIYSATKRGIHGITTTLALEVANENILVNTVCPGFTLTELTSKNNSTEQIGKIAETIPLKRLAQPEEIAEIVFYLCSEKNTYITGQENCNRWGLFSSMKIKSQLKNYEVTFTKKSSIFDIIYDNKNTFYVVDSKVYSLYSNDFLDGIPSNRLFLLKATEKNKNIKTVFNILDKMIEIPGKRNARLVSIGGGIVQDLTGFIANVLYRGIDWVFFPTTLLASADSCIGGKTSLNYKNFKNLLGTFYPPTKIYINTNFFKSLLEMDYLSGLGEVVKFNLMYGFEGLNRLEKDVDLLLKRDSKTIIKYNTFSLNFKKNYIQKDEFDRNERVLLNFAHTFGHAIESATNYKVPHGTAVAIGMIVANRISFKRGLLNENYISRTETILNQIIKTKKYNLKLTDLVDSIKKDKKQLNDSIRAILIDDSMNLSVVDDINIDEIKYGFEFTPFIVE